MRDIKVRRLEEWVLAVHRDLAEKAGHSFEEHVRRLLLDAALSAQHEFATEMALQLATLRAKYGEFSDSGEMIRQERWDRG